MAIKNSLPIKRALVQKIRDALDAAQADPPEWWKPSMDGIRNRVFEGVAAYNAPYPFVTYQLVYDPYVYTHTSATQEAGFDINVLHDNSVEAENLDQLLLDALQDASLEVEGGLTTLICRRIADLSSKDVDAEGHSYYQIGGTYEVWVDQQL